MRSYCQQPREQRWFTCSMHIFPDNVVEKQTHFNFQEKPWPSFSPPWASAASSSRRVTTALRKPTTTGVQTVHPVVLIRIVAVVIVPAILGVAKPRYLCFCCQKFGNSPRKRKMYLLLRKPHVKLTKKLSPTTYIRDIVTSVVVSNLPKFVQISLNSEHVNNLWNLISHEFWRLIIKKRWLVT